MMQEPSWSIYTPLLRFRIYIVLVKLYNKLLYNSMLCGAKLPFLLSLLSYLFSGNYNLREEWKENREKWREQKETTIFCRKLSFLFGWGWEIRTPTYRVRVCCAAITPIRIVSSEHVLLYQLFYKNQAFFSFFLFFCNYSVINEDLPSQTPQI